jgi:hypothetical protein
MKYILFNDRFVEAIKNGCKRQTIRLKRKHPIVQGERVCLRRWTGKPYRSKQEKIIEVEILDANDFIIDYAYGRISTELKFILDGYRLSLPELRSLALKDGFSKTSDFVKFFRQYKMPFNGILYTW